MVLSQLLPSLGFGFPWEKAAHGPDLERFQPLPKDRGALAVGCGSHGEQNLSWSFKSLLEHRFGQRSVNTAMNLGAHGSVQLCLTWKKAAESLILHVIHVHLPAWEVISVVTLEMLKITSYFSSDFSRFPPGQLEFRRLGVLRVPCSEIFPLPSASDTGSATLRSGLSPLGLCFDHGWCPLCFSMQ